MSQSKETSADNVALLTAVSKGYERRVKSLIKAGADVNTVKTSGPFNAYMSPVEKHLLSYWLGTHLKYPEIGKISPKTSITALMLAVKGGNFQCAELLVRAGADVNVANNWGMTSLLKAACIENNSHCVDLLIGAGADVKATNKLGLSALHFAACCNGSESIDLLVNAGADVNLNDNLNYTPLMKACEFRSNKGTHALIQAGADVNAVDSFGNTPLIWAALEFSTKCVRLLFKAGTNLQPDRNGQNASQRHLCIRGTSCEGTTLLDLLFAAGERVNGTTVTVFDTNGIAYHTRDVPDFVQKLNEPEQCLKGMCRAAIRKHLLDISSVNLFIRIPQLGLPTLIKEYLLYNISLDGEDESDNENSNDEEIVAPHVSKYGRTSKVPNRF